MRIMPKRAISAATVFISQIHSAHSTTAANSISLLPRRLCAGSPSTLTSVSSRCHSCCFVSSTKLIPSSPPAPLSFQLQQSLSSKAQLPQKSLTLSSCSYSLSSSSSSLSPPSSSFRSSPLHMQNRQILHFESLPSTQDETRRQLQLLATQAKSRSQTESQTSDGEEKGKLKGEAVNDDNVNNRYNIAITTSLQTNGRGTNGRKWISETGNTFVTIAVPSSDLLQRGNVPITLLPLQVGVIIAQRIDEILKREGNINADANENADVNVNVKWPNDVLVNGKKIAGVLIESEQVQVQTRKRGGGFVSTTENYFLIGIGINFKFAPKIDQNINSSERGRESTCICDYISLSSSSSSPTTSDEEDSMMIVQKAKDLGVTIANDIWDWVEMQANWGGAAEAVVQNFEHWTEFGQELVMRDTTGPGGGDEIVIPMCIEKDGRLKVKNKSNGVERLLCADYLL